MQTNLPNKLLKNNMLDHTKYGTYEHIEDWREYLGDELAEKVFENEPDYIRVMCGFAPKNTPLNEYENPVK